MSFLLNESLIDQLELLKRMKENKTLMSFILFKRRKWWERRDREGEAHSRYFLEKKYFYLMNIYLFLRITNLKLIYIHKPHLTVYNPITFLQNRARIIVKHFLILTDFKAFKIFKR